MNALDFNTITIQSKAEYKLPIVPDFICPVDDYLPSMNVGKLTDEQVNYICDNWSARFREHVKQHRERLESNND